METQDETLKEYYEKIAEFHRVWREIVGKPFIIPSSNDSGEVKEEFLADCERIGKSQFKNIMAKYIK